MIRDLLAGAVLTLGIATAGGASAQTAGAFMTNPAFRDPPPKQCNSTFQMQHCAAHALREADARMSARYNAVRARLGPAGRDRLLREQRRWLAQRDRSCMAKGEQYSGGTLSAVVVAQCWVDVTKARYRELSKYR